MESSQLFNQAEKLILKKLDETHHKSIKLFDHELGFYDPNDISEERDFKASILCNAFTSLKQKGLITYTSEDGRIPRHNLILTPKGRERVKNLIQTYKEEGVKACIKEVAKAASKYADGKFRSE